MQNKVRSCCQSETQLPRQAHFLMHFHVYLIAPPCSHCAIQQNLTHLPYKLVCHVSEPTPDLAFLSQHSLSQPSDLHSSPNMSLPRSLSSVFLFLQHYEACKDRVTVFRVNNSEEWRGLCCVIRYSMSLIHVLPAVP